VLLTSFRVFTGIAVPNPCLCIAITEKNCFSTLWLQSTSVYSFGVSASKNFHLTNETLDSPDPRYIRSCPFLERLFTSIMQQATHQRLHVRDAHDAHVLFEAVRQGFLMPITRRLNEMERSMLIRPGAIFVWFESEDDNGLKRWTGQHRVLPFLYDYHF